jgi:hypothetical protein
MPSAMVKKVCTISKEGQNLLKAPQKTDVRFAHMHFKVTTYHQHAFQKLYVRVKPEIVHAGRRAYSLALIGSQNQTPIDCLDALSATSHTKGTFTIRSIIHVKKLTIFHGLRPVLRDIDFAINHGEFIFLTRDTGRLVSFLTIIIIHQQPFSFVQYPPKEIWSLFSFFVALLAQKSVSIALTGHYRQQR